MTAWEDGGRGAGIAGILRPSELAGVAGYVIGVLERRLCMLRPTAWGSTAGQVRRKVARLSPSRRIMPELITFSIPCTDWSVITLPNGSPLDAAPQHQNLASLEVK
jgi:hypothetical protein